MRNTYVKPNSYTQVQKNELNEAAATVMQLVDMSSDEWNEMMFELGCQFVEQNASRDLCILTDERYCFWDWWVYIYKKDDKEIVQNNLIDSLDYRFMKNSMVTDAYLVNLFDTNYYYKIA